MGLNRSSSLVIKQTFVPATGRAGFADASRLRAHAQATSGGDGGYPAASRAPCQNGPERATFIIHSPAVTKEQKEALRKESIVAL